MRASRQWVKPLARAGYSARGLIYMIIGILTVVAAFGAGSQTGTRDAVVTLLQQPFGRVLTWLLVVGLVGYVIWRLIQSLFDTDDHGIEPKGLAVRAGLLASAFTYATLALYSLSLLGVFSGQGGGGGSARDSIATTIEGVIGTSAVTAGLGIIFAGIAAAHWWKAATRKYEDHMEADANAMKLIHPVSIAGLTARGAVFAILAVLLFYRLGSGGSTGGQTPGLEEALNFVQDLPYGGWLLALLGIGLAIFAMYSFAEARWRRINIEDA